ncbi:MAG: lipopolysaccharide biosynthesis protein [Parvularcula sp.]
MSKNDGASGDHLDGKVARGAAIMSAARIGARLIGFINTLVLARLLTPDDFGVVAIGVTIMQLLQNFSDIGVAQAVIKYHDGDRDQTDTLFTLSLLRGVGVAAILAILAISAGRFYADPRMTIIFLAFAGTTILTGLINPRFYEFERDLDFSKEAFVSIALKVISVLVSILIAVVFRSYWAIVAGYGAGVLSQLVLSYVLKPYRPRLSLKSVSRLIEFSGWVTATSALVALNNKTEVLIIGRMLGTRLTGLFHVGEQVAAIATTELATPIARAVYPGLSTLQADADAMRRAFLRGTEALAAIALPAAVGSALVAEEIVAILLGDKWPGAVPIVQVFGPVLGLMSIFFATQGLAMAAGMTRLVFFRELIFLCVKFPVFIIATKIWGLTGALAAVSLNSVVYVSLQSRLYAQVTKRSAFEPIITCWRSILALSGMVVWFWLIRPVFADGLESLPTIVRLCVDVSFGATGFIFTHFALWRLSGRPDGIERSVLRIGEKFFPFMTERRPSSP